MEEQTYPLLGEKGDAVLVELAFDSKYMRRKSDSVDVLAKEAKAAVDEAAQRKVEAQRECHSVERGGSSVLVDENHNVEQQGRFYVLEDESHIHSSSSESGARGEFPLVFWALTFWQPWIPQRVGEALMTVVLKHVRTDGSSYTQLVKRLPLLPAFVSRIDIY